MEIDVGSTAGDYQVIGILGAGGMGKVFKVRNVISDRQEAMKVLLPDLANAPDLANRFLREIKVTASLDHPNIAALRTAVRVDNQLLMIMEFVEGTTLEARLKNGPLPVKDAVDYISQALAALGYAHKLGVVHRDIKPANMMLTPNGVVKLMDFGIAKNAADRKLTQTGMTLGSLYYMSPEQIQGSTDLDARADLYSLGITLYELVTGIRPFDGDSQFAIMSAHLQKQPVPPIQLDPKVPAALNDVILLSVQKDPKQRFQTADAFRQALQNVVAAPVVKPQQATFASAPAMAAPAVAPVAREPQPQKSRRGLWIAAGAFCAVAAVVGVIQFGPKKNVGAEAPASIPSVSVPAASTPAANSPSSTPASTTPLVSSPAPASVPEKKEQAAAPTGQPAAKNPRDAATTAQVQRPPQSTAPAGQQTAPITSQQVQAPPPQVQQAPPQQQAAAPAGPSPEQVAKRAELMKVREGYALLNARAVAIRSSMQTFKQRQASTGLGVRADWVQAESLMETFLKAVDDASKASDTDAAKDYMNKAERQIEKLETAFNIR